VLKNRPWKRQSWWR